MTARKYNAAAAEKLGLSKDLIHVGKFHGPMLIEPHGQESIKIVGNEILPTRAEVSILQSHSGKPSVFKMSLPHELQNMPEPRRLPESAVFTGTDGITAVKTALADASALSTEVHVIAASPAENSDFLEPQSRLRAMNVKNWVVTLFLRDQSKYYTAYVKGNDVVDKKIYPGRDQAYIKDRNPTPVPVIGNQKALDFVNSNLLICGNWKGLRLSNIRIGTQWSFGWFLPYRGPDSFPIIVDAVSGDLLVMSNKEESFKRATVQDIK